MSQWPTPVRQRETAPTHIHCCECSVYLQEVGFWGMCVCFNAFLLLWLTSQPARHKSSRNLQSCHRKLKKCLCPEIFKKIHCLKGIESNPWPPLIWTTTAPVSEAIPQVPAGRQDTLQVVISLIGDELPSRLRQEQRPVSWSLSP